MSSKPFGQLGNSLYLRPSRSNKENITDGISARAKARDPLSNITNNVRNNGPGKVMKVQEKNIKCNTIKRPASQIQGKTETHLKVERQNKKRKSDPMIIVEEESVSPPQPLYWEDIDANDLEDPQAVSAYAFEIYGFLMQKEKMDRVNPSFLSHQTEINDKMRAILIDWLVEVHRMFKLLPETLFLSVNIIDRFLEVTQVVRTNLQLVGITSMLIASKYEEIYSPECNDFVYISDGAYTKDQILTMEQQILNKLNFKLTYPSPLHFLRRFSKAAGSDYTMHSLCKYIIELMLTDVKFLNYTPSLLAAGSVYIARVMFKKSPLWTSTLHYYSTYSEDRVREVAFVMNEHIKNSQKSNLKAINKKYSSPKFGQVAELPLADIM